MQSLGRRGLVTAQRGKHGGFLLAKVAEVITVLDVIDTVEPRECPLGIAAHGAKLCPLHKRLDAAMAMIEKAFGETSFAEILAEPSRSKPLCRIAGVSNVA